MTAPPPAGPPCIPDHSVPVPCPGCTHDERGRPAMTTTDQPQGLRVAPGALSPKKGRSINVPAPAYPGDPLPGAVAFKAGVRAWLEARGLDPDGPDLVDTPQRVLAALNEFTAGYDEDPAVHLARTFPADHSGTPIVVTGVPFTSLCAHHLLPFHGHADIAYVPSEGQPVAGLSKLPRVLDVYARRLQTQEDLTRQVVDALVEHLVPLGAACVIRSEHGCLAHRGARKPGAVMVTTSYSGIFLDSHQARMELHRLMSG